MFSYEWFYTQRQKAIRKWPIQHLKFNSVAVVGISDFGD